MTPQIRPAVVLRRPSLMFLLLVSAVVMPSSLSAATTEELMTPQVAGMSFIGEYVANAGDLNGDGYDDVVVGASQNAAAGANAGAVYVYLGGPSADDVADLFLTGAAAGDLFGTSVDGAGDMNGDGYDDLIVGAPGNGAGGAGAGRAYVYFGGAVLNGTVDLILTGAAAGDNFGTSVAMAGDLNGDGYDDVAVSAPWNDALCVDGGRVYVYYGGSVPNNVADESLGSCVIAGTRFGMSIDGAGDFDGDGLDDLIVGADFSLSPTNYGNAWICFGRLGGGMTVDAQLAEAEVGGWYGVAVAGVGDVNGDGRDDVVVGSPAASTHGRAYLYLGGVRGGYFPIIFTGGGGLGSPRFGYSVSGLGDIDGDGYADFAVGEPWGVGYAGLLIAVGQVFVFLGGPTPDTDADFTFEGNDGNRAGGSIGGGGDIDGDGRSEFLIAQEDGTVHVYATYPYRVLSPNGGDRWVAGTRETVRWQGHDLADVSLSSNGGLTWNLLAGGVGGHRENELSLIVPPVETAAALVRITYRSKSPTPATSDASDGFFRITAPYAPSAATRLLALNLAGEAAGDAFGVSAASAGDVNADGFDDVIVGAFWNDALGSETGEAYIYYGGPAADTVPDHVLTGAAAGDRFGIDAASAGDFNGDGFDDVIVGGYRNDAVGTDGGRAYLYYGGPEMDETADRIFSGEASGDNFGVSVAAAGDVNGDGYDDVVIGAYYNDAGGAFAGRAYVYFGGPASDTVADIVLTGQAAGDYFGLKVAGVGDVNGDGYGDVLVGAYQNDAGGADAGRAYLFFGGPVADATADLVLTGEAAGDYFGAALAGAGDVDGDGFDDFLVGAYHNDGGNLNPSDNRGRAYLFSGGSKPDATPDLVFTGEAVTDRLGISVSGAGDVNADGYADMLVGAYTSDGGAASPNDDRGRVYLYYGGPGTDSRADLVFNGDAAGDHLGSAVGRAGDVDGDGFADIILGAYLNDSAGTDAGRAYVYSCFPYRVLTPDGGETWVAGAPATVRWLGSERADISITTDGGLSWTTLAADMGGAGENSVVVFAPDRVSSSARIRVGDAGVPAGRYRADDSDGEFRIVGPAAPVAFRAQTAPMGQVSGDEFGISAGGIGDLNGDGFEDYAVGAYRNDAGGTDAGRAYVYFGGPDYDQVADLILTGETLQDNFGWSVAGAGDVNGDGYADLVVGARLNDGAGSNSGRAYVYFGGAVPNGVADMVLTGQAAGDYFGHAVAGAGDLNRDGFDDVLVGAYNADGSGVDSGRGYVFFGGAAPDNLPDMVLSGSAASDNFGYSVTGTGDMNGDGFPDFAIGARLDDDAGSNAGRAFVYFGGAPPDTVPDLVLSGENANDYFGVSVSGGGDVDGDGFPDLAVGAYFNDAAGVDAGRVYLFRGGPELDAVADLVLNGEAAGDYFGFSLWSRDDINADGFADVLVGAYRNDGGGSNSGRAYLYHGATRPDAVADAVFTGNNANDSFGISVGCPGDLNGDGFRDVLIGAYRETQESSGAGRVYLYDSGRYHVLSPSAADTWSVGARRSVSWLGEERADIWLSVDGGDSYSLLRESAGGAASNIVTLTVPHRPTRFAKIRITPHRSEVGGTAESDSLFTIEASIALLNLKAEPIEGGGVLLSWETDPGPEDLAGYKVERAADDRGPWRVLATVSRETSYSDHSGAAGMRYRLSGINGLGEELLLGEVALTPRAPLAAWPLPYRGGDLTISFLTASGLGGAPARTSVSVHDLNGRLVRQLVDEEFAAGYRAVAWDGRDDAGRPVSSGVYFIRSVSAGVGSRVKLVMLR